MADLSPSWTEIRRNLDRTFVVLTLGLFALGLLALVSASLGVRRYHPEYPLKQLAWGVLGAVAYVGVLKVGYQRILRQAVPLYLGALVLALFALLFWRMVKVALQSKDLRAKILVASLSAWLWFQVVESIAMSMGLAPITGLPLPLFSYGGSSLLAEALALGLVQSVALTTSQERFD